MKIFEFHLNPKADKHAISASFCYEPAKKEERHLGQVCFIGELINLLPQNKSILRELAETIKKAYYRPTLPDSEAALQEALREANQFLGSLSKQGNVSWMGNLHAVVLSFSGDTISVSRTGGIRTFMERAGELTDLDERAEERNQAVLHPFPYFVSGTMLVGDNIFIVTPELFRVLESLELVSIFPRLQRGKEEKHIKNLLKSKEKELKQYSGLLVLLHADKIAEKRERAAPSRQPRLRMKMPALSLPIPSGFSLPRPSLLSRFSPAKSFKLPSIAPKIPSIPFGIGGKKNILILGAFALVLLAGFGIAQVQRQKQADLAEDKLLMIQQVSWDAQAKTIAGQEQEANALFQRALEGLQELQNTPVAKRAEKLKEEITQQLVKINRLETIAEPEILFEIADADGASPDVLSRIGDTLYLADSKKPNLIFFNLNTREQGTQQLEKPLPLFAQLEELLVFYDKENRQLLLPDAPSIDLFPPITPFEPADMKVFGTSVYFLDTQRGQIVKYQFLRGQRQLIPTSWIQADFDTRLRKGISMAIDGNIWVLDSNGSIHRFRGGSWQETLDLSLWPKLERPTKLFAALDLPYFFVADPAQKRVILVNERGEIVKQYQSETFDDLKDVTASEDGSILYILNGLQVYKIVL